jgi:hypothetical protein
LTAEASRPVAAVIAVVVSRRSTWNLEHAHDEVDRLVVVAVTGGGHAECCDAG